MKEGPTKPQHTKQEVPVREKASAVWRKFHAFSEVIPPHSVRVHEHVLPVFVLGNEHILAFLVFGFHVFAVSLVSSARFRARE
jgi:hypothetical protein